MLFTHSQSLVHSSNGTLAKHECPRVAITSRTARTPHTHTHERWNRTKRTQQRQRQHQGSEKNRKRREKNHLATTVDIHWYTSITKHFAFKYWQQREKPSLTTHTSFTSLAEAQRYKTTAAKNENKKNMVKKKGKKIAGRNK